MNIDKSLLQKISAMAKLSFNLKDGATMVHDLSNIITWVEKLNEIDTKSVQPLVTMSTEENILREDEPEPPLTHERALRNAPRRDANYFRVPPVVNK